MALVELAGVRVAFEGSPPVFDGLDLSLDEGALVGLIGPPSCGKSVLLKLIAGLVPIRAGRARIAGADPSRPDERRVLQRGIGMLFQNTALFDSLTVLDNVCFPLRRLAEPPPEPEILERARARLAEVGLGHALQRFPHELSGGMQKRAGIARATVAAPRLRLFDEPTAGLDPVTSARILALITELHARDPSGVTVIVSNEMDTLLAAVPTLLVLDAGRVAWRGPTAQLDAAPTAVRDFIAGTAA